MKKRCLAIKAVVGGVLVFFCLSFLLITPVFAASCGGVETTLIECEEKGTGAIWHILRLIVEIMTGGVGILALIGILVFGVQYLTAGGDVSKTTKAKSRLLQIVIGVVVFAVLWTGSEWLMPGGIFNSSNEVDIAYDPDKDNTSNDSNSNQKNDSTSTDSSDGRGNGSDSTVVENRNKIASVAKSVVGGYYAPSEKYASLLNKYGMRVQTNCSLLGALAILESGSDPDFKNNFDYKSLGDGSHGSADLENYLKNSNRWEQLTTYDYLPGDILISGSNAANAHTRVYVGDGKIVQASLSEGTYPSVYNARKYGARVYRLK